MTMINKCLTGKAFGFDRPRQALIQVLWGMVTNANVDYLIWEDFKFQIDSRQISAKKKEHAIKLDAVLGNLKFVNKGEEHLRYGMAIPKGMMSDNIKDSADYSNYLAKSTTTQSGKGRGKGLLTIDGIKVDVQKKKETIRLIAVDGLDGTERGYQGRCPNEVHPNRCNLLRVAFWGCYIRVPRKKRTKTVVEETDQSEELADLENLEEAEATEEERHLNERHSSLVIGRDVNMEIDEETHDHSTMKLKGVEYKYNDERTETDNSDDDARKKKAEKIQVLVPKLEKKKPKVPPPSPNPVKTETQSMVDVPMHEDNPVSPKPQLPQSKTKIIIKKPKQSEEKVDVEVVLKRLMKLEKKVEAMSKIDHTEAIDKFVQAHLKKVLSKSIPDFDSLKEYDQKNKLMSLMIKSKSFKTHPTHQKLYDVLMDSLLVDEDDMDKQYEVQPTQKKRHHNDEDPPKDDDKDTKKRRKNTDASSKKDKDQAESSKENKDTFEPSKTKKVVDAEESIQDAAVDAEELTQDVGAPNQDKSKWFKQDVVERTKTPDTCWFKEPNVYDAPKQNWFNEMNCLQKDKLTKADLEGPAFTLLKGNFKNNIELEYNLEQCYLALTVQIDWANPEGGKCPYDLSKTLPFQGPPGYKTIPVDFFFNKDLEYLKTGNNEKKYALSLTKPKAARARHKVTSRHKVYSRMKILSVIRIRVDKHFGYGFLKEIIVRRAYQKGYMFNEADFPRLHLNDIEDMYLLKLQNKLHQLTGDEQLDLVNALHLFIRRNILKRMIEDVQLGVRSYQAKLNLTTPQTQCDGLKYKEPYTIVYESRGVVNQNRSKRKILMRADELHKFSDGTLKLVHDNLGLMLHNFVLGYNNQGMPNRDWSVKDQKRTTSMLKMIDNILLERRIMQSLESFVGGRRIETDYRLLMRT
ncbi:hypothetical protein Tco_0793029 [Tanacetum coccineum]